MRGITSYADFCDKYQQFMIENLADKTYRQKKEFISDLKRVTKKELQKFDTFIYMDRTTIFNDSFVIRYIIGIGNPRMNKINCYFDFPSDVPHKKNLGSARVIITGNQIQHTVPMEQFIDAFHKIGHELRNKYVKPNNVDIMYKL